MGGDWAADYRRDGDIVFEILLPTLPGVDAQHVAELQREGRLGDKASALRTHPFHAVTSERVGP